MRKGLPKKCQLIQVNCCNRELSANHAPAADAKGRADEARHYVLKLGEQMGKRSIGVKRIVVILSLVSIIAWVVFVFAASDSFSDMDSVGWLILSGGIVVAYLVPQLICKGVYWVLDGFKKDKER
jgi:uncharacterized membrane protein